MCIRCYEENYKTFGRCLFIENKCIRVGVTIDVGPRVIYFSLIGRENVMFNDTKRFFAEENINLGTWYAYGGHRLWVAPETMPETYYPDNDRVDYEQDDCTVTFYPKATPFGKKMSLSLSFSEQKPIVKIKQSIKNVSEYPSRFAVWSVTSLAPGGIGITPIGKSKTGYLPNRTIALWDYSCLTDKRLEITEHSVKITHDEHEEKPFKIGFNAESGFSCYAVNGQIFTKCFQPYKNAEYPDFSCNFESYTNKLFLECELLGELRTVLPYESSTLEEEWCIMDNDIDFKENPDIVCDRVLEKICLIRNKGSVNTNEKIS